jgi:hypothetical protein
MPARPPGGETTTVVTIITDPVGDLESQRVVNSIAGCRRVEGSPMGDGTRIRR